MIPTKTDNVEADGEIHGASAGWEVLLSECFFSVVLEDGPIRVHFLRLDGLDGNVPMNGCTRIHHWSPHGKLVRLL